MQEYEGKYLVKAPDDYYYKGEHAYGFNYAIDPREALIFKDIESAEQLAYSLNNIVDGLSQHIVGKDIYYTIVSMGLEIMSYRIKYEYEIRSRHLSF